MPATVVKTGRDETLWSKAKRLAEQQYPKVATGSERYYRLVMGIYNRMKGGTVIKKAFGRTGGQRAGHKYVRRVALSGGGYRYIYPGDEPKGRGAEKPEDEGEPRRPGAEEEPPKPKKFVHGEFAGLAANAVGKGDGKVPAPEATKKLTSAFKVYAEKFDGAMEELKGKGFNDFVGPETKKVADDLIIGGETTGYNIDHLGVAKRDYTNLLRAGNCIFYHQYVQNADHGRELLARMTTAGLICPYKVSRMASTVLWDDEWGKDAEVEYEDVGGKKLGRSFQYSLVFQPRSAEEADAVADFIGHHAKAGAKQPIEHSWFVPDVRSTFKEKVDEYEQRYLNTREVGDDEILVLKKEQMKGFKAEPIWLNPGLAKFVKAYTLTTLTKGHRRAHTRRLRSGRAIREWLELKKARVKGHTRRTKKKVTRVRAHARKDRPKKPEPPKKPSEPAAPPESDRLFAGNEGVVVGEKTLNAAAKKLAARVEKQYAKYKKLFNMKGVERKLRGKDWLGRRSSGKANASSYSPLNYLETPHLIIHRHESGDGYVVGLGIAIEKVVEKVRDATGAVTTMTDMTTGRTLKFTRYYVQFKGKPVYLPGKRALAAFLETAGFDLSRFQLAGEGAKEFWVEQLHKGNVPTKRKTRYRYAREPALSFIAVLRSKVEDIEDDFAEAFDVEAGRGINLGRLSPGLRFLPEALGYIHATIGRDEDAVFLRKNEPLIAAYRKYGITLEVPPTHRKGGEIHKSAVARLNKALNATKLFNDVIELEPAATDMNLKFKFSDRGAKMRQTTLAQYEKKTTTITIKSDNVSSLAHEFGHFIDDYTSGGYNPHLVGRYLAEQPEPPPTWEKMEAFKQLLVAVAGERLKAGHGIMGRISYIMDKREIFARFISQHVAERLKEKGVSRSKIEVVTDDYDHVEYGEKAYTAHYHFNTEDYKGLAAEFKNIFAGTKVEPLLKALGLI